MLFHNRHEIKKTADEYLCKMNNKMKWNVWSVVNDCRWWLSRHHQRWKWVYKFLPWLSANHLTVTMKTTTILAIFVLAFLVNYAAGQRYSYEEGRREGIREGLLEERLRDDVRRLRRDEERLRRDERRLGRTYGGWWSSSGCELTFPQDNNVCFQILCYFWKCPMLK